jgi:DNA invertase Pin-like site-specific DNA recombinase
MNPKISIEHLARKAFVYVRQSTPGQVTNNLESRRRQYDLTGMARELGFKTVEVIDDDLGRSGSGRVYRPGFEKLVGAVCAGEAGAVLCIEASRLARNGRDWHHLIDLCALVGTVVADPEGIYDPRISNDRLLLGLKGTMSEFELGLIRQRSFEAIRAKAARGELRFGLPIGYCWAHDGRMDLEPDRRVQEAISLVFSKFKELSSARQVLLWFRGKRMVLPTVKYGHFGREIHWRLPIYNTILAIIKNPIYAGAYAFGRRESKTRVVDGRAHKTDGHRKPRSKWTVLLRDHHPGYISWERYEENQRKIEENARMKNIPGRRGPGGGRALLSGLLRCGQCGRMLHVVYLAKGVPRYFCRGANVNHGVGRCISFGGLRADQAMSAEVLRSVEPSVIQASLLAAQRFAEAQSQARTAVELELEEAKYQSRLAARRYESVDPDKRLVAAELEARWNAALERVQEVERRLDKLNSASPKKLPDAETLLSLARDLPAVWSASTTDMRIKQRIVRILVEEVVANVDPKTGDVELVIHWAGGRHSPLRFHKNKTGRHRRCTDLSTIEIIRRMAGRWPDDQIASTLNRLGLRTGAGNNWSALRVNSARSHHQLPGFDPGVVARRLTLEQTAERCGVSATVVRKLITRGLLPATQVVAAAPWEISIESLDLPAVRSAITAVRGGGRVPRTALESKQLGLIPNT